MKFPRLLALTVALVLLPGCVGYTKFRATNPRGEMVAEWIGHGLFYPVSNGYRITAVQRISGPPLMHISRYPYGRRVTVTGAHIERWHTHRPEWLDDLRNADDPGASYPPEPVRTY